MDKVIQFHLARTIRLERREMHLEKRLQENLLERTKRDGETRAELVSSLGFSRSSNEAFNVFSIVDALAINQ